VIQLATFYVVAAESELRWPLAESLHTVTTHLEDDPQKAADLILSLMSDEAASVNGQFLWIKDGLQAPIASWSVESDSAPWQVE